MKPQTQGSLMTLAVILFAFIMALLFFSCEKPIEEKPITTGTVTFWTTENMGWVLSIDHNKVGQILKPYPINTLDKIPVCGDKRFTSIELTPGTHFYYLTLYIPVQPLPNYFKGQTYYFDVTLGGCTIVRAEQ